MHMQKDNHVIGRELLKAVIKNKPKKVKKLLEYGADPNYFEDDAQITPLHFAALYDSKDVVHLLIMAGADIHAKNGDNETPFGIAFNNANSSVATLLSCLHEGSYTLQ